MLAPRRGTVVPMKGYKNMRRKAGPKANAKSKKAERRTGRIKSMQGGPSANGGDGKRCLSTATSWKEIGLVEDFPPR